MVPSVLIHFPPWIFHLADWWHWEAIQMPFYRLFPGLLHSTKCIAESQLRISLLNQSPHHKAITFGTASARQWRPDPRFNGFGKSESVVTPPLPFSLWSLWQSYTFSRRQDCVGGGENLQCDEKGREGGGYFCVSHSSSKYKGRQSHPSPDQRRRLQSRKQTVLRSFGRGRGESSSLKKQGCNMIWANNNREPVSLARSCLHPSPSRGERETRRIVH